LVFFMHVRALINSELALHFFICFSTGLTGVQNRIDSVQPILRSCCIHLSSLVRSVSQSPSLRRPCPQTRTRTLLCCIG
jgi:hypothetical protein